MNTRLALTLIELIVVLTVLAALASITIPLCSDQLSNAAQSATRATLVESARALQHYWHDTKLIELDGMATVATESQRFNSIWLFRNPVTGDASNQFDPRLRIGWNGPYLLSVTAVGGDPDLVDGWHQPLSVQYVNPGETLKDVRIVSAGANGTVDIPANVATSSLTPSHIGDDLYVAISLR
ncbi:MAG: prepilin-type N-terminal cleavage/methylation domain-containing protein [Pirellulaceae bacterium]|nr:prepilin-type N-terminal cleavage/methylation domain-containing protein [Pirellulaceae bacterium]